MAAKSPGVKFGPTPKMPENQRDIALEPMAVGESFRAIAESMGVGRTKISRMRG